MDPSEDAVLSAAGKKLTLPEVKQLACLTARLFYGTSVAPKYDVIAKLSRKLLAIHPNCSTAIRYLARSIQDGAIVVAQDVVGTKFKDLPLEWLKANVFKDKLVAELSRKALLLNPNDRDTSYLLSYLVTRGVPVEDGDFIGTCLEGKTLSGDRLENGRILTQKVLDLYPPNIKDRIYYKARMQFSIIATFTNDIDTEETPEHDLDYDYIESICNASSRYREILKECPSMNLDFMRTSIICKDAPLSITSEALSDFQIQQYLEIEYIRQERLLSLSQDLSYTAQYLFYKEEVPLTENLLVDTKWADQSPIEVNRYELIAEYCRLALKCDPDNISAIQILSECYLKGIPVQPSDLRRILFGKQPPEAVTPPLFSLALCRKTLACKAKIEKALSHFVPIKTQNGQDKVESVTDKKEDVTIDAIKKTTEYSFEGIHEEGIEPEPGRPKTRPTA